MRRLLLAFFMSAALVFPQLGPPRLGYVRAEDGAVKPLSGVSGSFAVGDTIFRDVDRIWFDGRRGVALTAAERIDFDAAGNVRLRTELAGAPAFPDCGATWSGDEVKITKTGVQVRLPFEVRIVERVGAEYLLVQGDAHKRLLRTTPGREALYELPEVAQ